ncbi:hypothetical protein ACQKP1_07730 [Allorhizobium sp. NPDC080224]|uniref:hypothetical protein n=1 Tax=Allorhizobium sp. NPDC080224 TaxID=3390547 RepID=UPI003CFECAF3
MAKLPPIEVNAILAREELHKGKGSRDKALELLEAAGDGPLAQELRDQVKKRGRQPFGAKHRWWDIGTRNDELLAAGASYAERLETLAREFHLSDESKVKTAIAQYERAYAARRRIDEENR